MVQLRWFFKSVISTALILSLSLVMFTFIPRVHAEENPASATLTYMSGISNWGPTKATGLALVWRNQAEVRVTVANLPVLKGAVYGVWLVDLNGKKMIPAGHLNTGSDGTAEMDSNLPGKIPSNYTLVMLTYQPGDGSNMQSSNQNSIAGFLSDQQLVETSVKQLPGTGRFADDGTATGQPPVSASIFISILGICLIVFFVGMLKAPFHLLRATLSHPNPSNGGSVQ